MAGSEQYEAEYWKPDAEYTKFVVTNPVTTVHSQAKPFPAFFTAAQAEASLFPNRSFDHGFRKTQNKKCTNIPNWCNNRANKCALICKPSQKTTGKPSIISGASRSLTHTHEHLEVNKKLLLSETCYLRTAARLQTIALLWQRKPHQRGHVMLT